MQPRSTIALILLCAAATACDDGDERPPADAPPVDIGFNKPTATLKANDKGMELGPADLSCLGTPSTDTATTVAVTLETTVRDFQDNTIVANAGVTAFRGADVANPFDTKTADGDAKVSVLIEVGTKRFGFKMTDGASLDTLLLNQIVDPGMAMQTFTRIQSVSKKTAATLSAFIGKTRTAGTGVLAGAMYDCADRPISNFIATVSSTSGTVTHLPGADTYYFDPTTPLPVRHTVRGSASSNGLFMVIELPVTPVAYVQVWGFPTDADLASGQLKLIAELQAPVIADTVITGSYEPLRTGS
jgi:hypothetical protein